MKRDTKKKIKRKIKKVNFLFFIILFLVIIGLGIGGYFLYNYYQDMTLKQIKNNYYKTVITIKNTNLYDKKYKKIGSITKGIDLELEEVKKLSLKTKYFKIKGTNYYVKYDGIKKKKKKDEEKIDNYYLPINVNIKSNKEVSLLSDKKTIIKLNKLDEEVQYMDKDYYYIAFQDKILKIKKNKDIVEKKTDKEVEGAAKSVSALRYLKIDNNCSDDTCFKLDSVKIHIKKLKNEGYYFITKDDFIDYLNGYKNLKEKAVFITTDEENDNTENIKNELGVEIKTISADDGITFTNSNLPASPSDPKDQVNSYIPKRYTLIDTYSLMASGGQYNDVGPESSGDQAIGIVNYHFFYDETFETCDESICLTKSKFREHLQWLQDNGYKTLSINEFVDWMDGNIEIPDKSVLLTVDDGAMGTGSENGNILIPLLEEYKMHATLFLISGWHPTYQYQSPYLDLQSHTHNLHYEASCADGRGKVACSDYATVKEDLEISISELDGDNTTFCFPFYSYDNESLQALHDLGFRYSFIGGNRKARRSDNHYLIPRFPILSDITIYEFASLVS